MKHLYIHIPFCKNICSYCDFCKMYYNEKFVKKYLEALKEEIYEYYNGETMESIYIGGGTPSSLSCDELEFLFTILKDIKRTTNAEITFECNPDDINDKLLKILTKYGVNRISIGIESFNEEKLKVMERKADYHDIKDKLSLIRYYGINNINLDIIYGVPGEDLNVLKKDVNKILKLKPEHISLYSLIIEENTKLGIKKTDNIDEDLEREMYDYIIKKLSSKKYKQYEVSNFSIPGYESVHNKSYWNNEEYYGFGLGASGYMNGFRYDNTRNLNKYIKKEYHSKESLLSKQETMEYEVMLGLRKTEGINLKEFYKKYECNIQDVFPVRPLLKNKQLIYKNGYLFINPKYMYTMNEILLKLI